MAHFTSLKLLRKNKKGEINLRATFLRNFIQISRHWIVSGSVVVFFLVHLWGTHGFANIPEDVTSHDLLQSAARKIIAINMRFGLEGDQIVVSLKSKLGERSVLSEFSPDGLTETRIEVYPRKTAQIKKAGYLFDVRVTKLYKGNPKKSNDVQMFVPVDQEAEFVKGSRRAFSGAIMAHEL